MPVATAIQVAFTATIKTPKGVIRIGHDTKVDAVDMVCDHAIPNNGSRTINIPSVDGSFLLVESTGYSDGDKKLTYKTKADPAVSFDAPLMLVGGAMKLLAGIDGKLEVKNETGEEVRITLVGGRHVTADPQPS